MSLCVITANSYAMLIIPAKNRSCPTCHESDRKAWLEKRRQERLPVPYFHAVFTLPKELREIIRSHQKTGYAILMEAAALSLMKLAEDPRYVGGQIGMLAVLHTWTRALVYHPHVHCLIPAGGLSPDHQYWLEARKNYLVPVRALSEIFRATFMALIRKKLPQVVFPQSLWEKSWVVYCKSGGHTADKRWLILPGTSTRPRSPTAGFSMQKTARSRFVIKIPANIGGSP